jgi:hypothetical protein
MGSRMQSYNVVVASYHGDGPLDMKVHTRKYRDIGPCPTCGGDRSHDYNARLDAAYADGLALGKMLHARGVEEFMRGLQAGLHGQ